MEEGMGRCRRRILAASRQLHQALTNTVETKARMTQSKISKLLIYFIYNVIGTCPLLASSIAPLLAALHRANGQLAFLTLGEWRRLN